jgi:hypothetical protein
MCPPHKHLEELSRVEELSSLYARPPVVGEVTLRFRHRSVRGLESGRGMSLLNPSVYCCKSGLC